MGFDTGLLLANLLFAYLSQPGHHNNEEHANWILEQTVILFEAFDRKFQSLWKEKESDDSSTGELLRAWPDAGQSHHAKEDYMQDVWNDTIGFAGAEMIRRIVGIAHVEDLDGIEDTETRSFCEKRCLYLARHLMMQSTKDGYQFHLLPLAKKPRDLVSLLKILNTMDISTAEWPKES